MIKVFAHPGDDNDKLGSTAVSAQFNAPGLIKDQPKSECESNQYVRILFCEGKKLPDGSLVVNVLSTSQDNPKSKLATSRHYRLDGSVTFFTAYN